MEHNKFNFEFRAAYIEGRLSPEEVRVFEDALVDDEKLLTALKRQMYLEKWAEDFTNEGVDVEDVQAETDEETQQGKSRPLLGLFASKSMRWAAVILLLITTAIILYPILRGNQSVFDQYYITMANETSRGLNEADLDANDPLVQAFSAYDKKDYQRAADLFQQHLNAGPNEVVLFYLAMAQIELGKPEAAETTLTSYLETYANYQEEARWYLALAKIKLGKTDEAKPLLNQLAETGFEYREKANEILVKIQE